MEVTGFKSLLFKDLRRVGAPAVLTLFLLGVGMGCATPKPLPSKRQGLFANLENGGVPRSTRSNQKKGAQRELASQGASTNSAGGSGRASRSPSSVSLQFQWPLDQVAVTSRYGERGGAQHEGIDLRARIGTQVRAAEAGRVVYAGNQIRGYGRLIVIRHAEGLATVYAHHSQILVKKGQFVKKGQKIGFSGKSGTTSGPHLHFEIRDGVVAVDPEAWIKSREKQPQLADAHLRN
jgi:murein DD-endopeptidase MepM/ murein hydrolase activator NlpD